MQMQLSLSDLEPEVNNDSDEEENSDDEQGSDEEQSSDEEHNSAAEDVLRTYNLQIKYGRLPLEAIHSLTLLLEIYPNHEALLLRRSKLYYKHKQPNKALTDLTALLNANPLEAEGLYDRSVISFDLKNYNMALIDLARLLFADPENSIRALCLREKIYQLLVRDDDSINDLDRLLSDPNFLNNYSYENDRIAARMSRMKIYCKQKKLDEALLDLNILIKETSSAGVRLAADCFSCLITRGKIYAEQSRFDEELIDLNDILKRQPEHYDSLVRRSVVLMEKGNHRQSVLDEYTAHHVALSEGTHGVPSLVFMCKMAFFKHEPFIYTTGDAFRDPDRVRGALAACNINPATLATMKEKLNGCKIETKTVFDQLDSIDVEQAFRPLSKRQKIKDSDWTALRGSLRDGCEPPPGSFIDEDGLTIVPGAGY